MEPMRSALPSSAQYKFKEHARATHDTAYTLVDADVTLHEAQERIVVNSAGFSGRETYLDQYFRETEAFGADCDDVFVWEHAGLGIVRTFRSRC